MAAAAADHTSSTCNINFCRCLIAETVLGYIWWTFLLGIAPTIWIYPLETLGISGYEAFAVCLFSPILAGIGPIRRLIHSHYGSTFMRLLMVIALTSYEAPDILSRLIGFSIGTGIAMLASCGWFFAQSSFDRSVAFWGNVLGFLGLHASRVWFRSLSPVLAYPYYRHAVIALGITAALDRSFTKSTALQADSGFQPMKKPFWPVVSFGYGSLLYLMHFIFGEASLLSRWGVRPYPRPGPYPYPWGAAVVVALTVGVLMSTKVTPIRSISKKWYRFSILWWMVACLAFTGLYLMHTYVAFGAGLILGIYALSIWPYLFDLLTLCPAARTFALSLVVYLFLTLYTVWTIAFNFVPGGVYTRESYHFMIVFMLVSIGITIVHYTYPESGKGVTKNGGDSYSRTSFPSLADEDGKKSPWTYFNRYTKKGLFIILAVSLLGFGARYNPTIYERPALTEPKRFTVMIWNIRYGFDNYGLQSFDRIAAIINETGSDVVGLMECDCARPFLGSNDLGVFLGEKLGMYVDYGVGTREHTWGCMLLSKFPIVDSEHFSLPSPRGEVAPALRSTLNVSGDLVDVVVTHMGNDIDDLDRKLQAKKLSEVMNSSKLPLVFLGYVTSEPYSRDYRQLIKVGRIKDIDPSDADRWCLYIFYRDLIRLAYARISHGILTDTEIQSAKFEIAPSKNYRPNTETTHDSSKVSKDVKYPDRFGEVYHGHYGGNDHHYHMSTPKYFTKRRN